MDCRKVSATLLRCRGATDFRESTKMQFSPDRLRKWGDSLVTINEHMQGRCMASNAQKKTLSPYNFALICLCTFVGGPVAPFWVTLRMMALPIPSLAETFEKVTSLCTSQPSREDTCCWFSSLDYLDGSSSPKISIRDCPPGGHPPPTNMFPLPLSPPLFPLSPPSSSTLSFPPIT